MLLMDVLITKKHKMKEKELINMLLTKDEDMDVLLVDLQDDGCGDGVSFPHSICSVETEKVLDSSGKKQKCVFITYNE